MKKIKWLLPLSLVPGLSVVPLVSCDNGTSTYAITCNVFYGTYTGDTEIKSDQEATITITPDGYHNFPQEITVEGAKYTYDNTIGQITLFEPTGPIVITAECVLKSDCYEIIETCENCSIEGEKFIQENVEQTLTIVPYRDYICPKKEEITIDGAQIKEYDRATGVLKLLKASTKQNNGNSITLTINCAKGWTVTLNAINCAIKGSQLIADKGKETYTIEPERGYTLPEQSQIETTNASIETYDKTGKKLTILSNGGGNVFITVECQYIPKTFKIIDSITNGGFDGPTTIVESTQTTITIKPDECYSLPQSQADITIQNAELVSYDSGTGQLVIKNPTADVKIVTTCPAIPGQYPLKLTVSNGKTDHEVTKIFTNQPVTFILTPNANYTLPDDVSVSGAEWNYNKENKFVTIFNPTQPVTVDIPFVKVIDSITINGDNALSYNSIQKYDINVKFVTGKESDYTVSCDTADTGCTWDGETHTLTTGQKSCSLNMVIDFTDYVTPKFEFKINVVSSVFKYEYDTEHFEAKIAGLSDELKSSSRLVITIPNTVKKEEQNFNVVSVKGRAFDDENKIKKITIGDNVKSIDSYAFSLCEFNYMIFRENSQISYIGENAVSRGYINGTLHLYSKASSLTIDKEAFAYCLTLTKIILPKNLSKLGDRSFAFSNALASIDFEGTSSQWKAIERGEDWHQYVRASQVHCLGDDKWIDLDEK